MKTATLQDAIDAGACYLNEPGGKEKLAKLFGRRKALTVKQIAVLKIPDTDKVWALTRFHFLNTKEKSVRFAIFCAEQCLTNFERWNATDKRPREAIEAAKNWFANPTDSAARSAARSARSARSAAYSADSAYSAADSARSAAYSADSAYSAARSADSAAYSAYSADSARSAADSADSAAYSAYSADSAYSAARSAQLKFLVKLLTEETI